MLQPQPGLRLARIAFDDPQHKLRITLTQDAAGDTYTCTYDLDDPTSAAGQKYVAGRLEAAGVGEGEPFIVDGPFVKAVEKVRTRFRPTSKNALAGPDLHYSNGEAVYIVSVVLPSDRPMLCISCESTSVPYDNADPSIPTVIDALEKTGLCTDVNAWPNDARELIFTATLTGIGARNIEDNCLTIARIVAAHMGSKD